MAVIVNPINCSKTIIRYDNSTGEDISSTRTYCSIPYDVPFLEEFVYVAEIGCIVCHEDLVVYFSRSKDVFLAMAEHIMNHFFQYVNKHTELGLEIDRTHDFIRNAEVCSQVVTFRDSKKQISVAPHQYLDYIFSKVSLTELSKFVRVEKMVILFMKEHNEINPF